MPTVCQNENVEDGVNTNNNILLSQGTKQYKAILDLILEIRTTIRKDQKEQIGVKSNISAAEIIDELTQFIKLLDNNPQILINNYSLKNAITSCKKVFSKNNDNEKTPLLLQEVVEDKNRLALN